MAPVVISGSFRSTSGTAVTVAANEGSPVQDCLRLVFISCASGRDIVTSTAGWQRLYGSTSIGSGSLGVFARIFNTSDGAATFDFSNSTGSTCAVHIVTVRGQRADLPVVAAAGGTSEAAVIAPSAQASSDSLLVTFHALTGNPATFTLPTEMTVAGSSQQASGTGHSAATFSQIIAGGGLTGTRTSTASVSGNWRAASVIVGRAVGSSAWWALLAG